MFVFSKCDNWLLESRQLKFGVHLTRTLLPDKHRDISMRVVNTTSEPQALRQNLCIGNLQPVEVYQAARAASVKTAKPKDVVTNLETVDPVPNLLESLPSELSDEQREAVSDLMHRYEDVFTSGEFDVGRTRLITHHIDTGEIGPCVNPFVVAYCGILGSH